MEPESFKSGPTGAKSAPNEPPDPVPVVSNIGAPTGTNIGCQK